MNCPKDCVGQKECQCTQMINIKPGKVIQFTFYHMGRISGLSCTYHPMHIHGIMNIYFFLTVYFINCSTKRTSFLCGKR